VLCILVPVQCQISFIIFIVIAKDFLRKYHAVKLRRTMLLPSSKNCQCRNNSSLDNVKIALYVIAVPVRNVNKSGVRTNLATGVHVTFLPYREEKSRDPLLGGFWRHFCLHIAYRHKTIGQISVISYHRFPSDRNMLKKCLKAIRRDNCSFVYYSAILTMFIALPVP